MFTVKDLQVYKDSLKEKNQRTSASAEKTTAVVKTTPPSVARPAKQTPPLKLQVDVEPSKERKPLAVVHKAGNTTSPKPIPVLTFNKQADPLSKTKLGAIAKTPVPPSKAHSKEGDHAPIKTPQSKSDPLKAPMKIPSLKPHHGKSEASTNRKPKEPPSFNGPLQKTAPQSSPSLCSECTRAASEGAVCFIGNDGRVSACTTRSAVRLCKNLNCAANNPDYVAAMANAPKKYLVSKRHLLKAQYGLKSKSARPKSPETEVIVSTGDGLERPRDTEALSPHCTGDKSSGDNDSLSDEGQLSHHCSGDKSSGDIDSLSDDGQSSPINRSSLVLADCPLTPLNESAGADDFEDEHVIVGLSRNQLDGRGEGIEESHDCLDALNGDVIVLRPTDFSFHEPEANHVESPKFLLSESSVGIIEVDGDVDDGGFGEKCLDDEDVDDGGFGEKCLDDEDVSPNIPLVKVPDRDAEEPTKQDGDIISQNDVGNQNSSQLQDDPLQAQADGSYPELSHEETGDIMSKKACDDLRNDDNHDVDDGVEEDQNGGNLFSKHCGDLSPPNDNQEACNDENLSESDEEDEYHDDYGIEHYKVEDEASKHMDSTFDNRDREGQDGSSGGEGTKLGNNRRRRIVGLVEEPNPETVVLRKQQTQERKQVEEWMANYAIEGAVHKLAPTGETKVKVLVEAFETIISHTDLEGIDAPPNNASRERHS